jgi:hypothetical protein
MRADNDLLDRGANVKPMTLDAHLFQKYRRSSLYSSKEMLTFTYVQDKEGNTHRCITQVRPAAAMLQRQREIVEPLVDMAPTPRDRITQADTG